MYLIVTDRQTGRQTTCNLITALCVSSRGKLAVLGQIYLLISIRPVSGSYFINSYYCCGVLHGQLNIRQTADNQLRDLIIRINYVRVRTTELIASLSVVQLQVTR